MRHLKFVIPVFALVLMAACQTTGGAPIETRKLSDSKMSCADIEAETAEMNAIIEQVAQSRKTAQAANMGTSAASRAASANGSGWIGSTLSQFNGLASQSQNLREQDARAAESRKNTLYNLYTKQGC